MKELTATQSLVLRMIERAVEAGRPCPKNQEIADAIGSSTVSSGPKVLGQLERAGVIAVERGAISRVVTILASGKRTAGAIGEPHWSARGVVRKMPEPKIEDAATIRKRGDWLPPLPVNREPCPRCGVRADVGCRHSLRIAA